MDSFQIFISHFNGEKTIAGVIQNFLQDAFPSVKVFRSSDAESIETGEGKYQAILNALREAQIFVVLLSSESARRPWVAFETGFGESKGAKMFPLLVRGAGPSDIPSPFSEMHLRHLDGNEVEKMLSAIETKLLLCREPVSIKALLRDVSEAELAIPLERLELVAYVDASGPAPCLYFRLLYEGYRPILIERITVGIPNAIKDTAWPVMSVPGYLNVDSRKVGDVYYVFKEYCSNPSPPDARVSGGQFRVLPARVHPGEDVNLFELRFQLNRSVDFYDERYMIRYQIKTVDSIMDERLIPLVQCRDSATTQTDTSGTP